jgi:Cu2+-exporting ATPase
VTLSVDTPATVSCAHCGLPVPKRMLRGREHEFCCAGCDAVYAAIHAGGLGDYYALRDAAGAEAQPVTGTLDADRFAAFDTSDFTQKNVRVIGETAECDFLLEGVTCAACAWLIEKLPRIRPGIVSARLALRDRRATVRWDPSACGPGDVAAALARLGYEPHPVKAGGREEIERREERRRLIDLGVAGVCAGNVMLLAFALYGGDLAREGDLEGRFWQLFRWLSAAFGITALAWPGRVFFTSAIKAMRARVVNLDLPIAIALAGGGIAGLANVILGRGDIYFDSLCVLVFLLLSGRFLQHRQQRKAAESVALLRSLVPSTARKLVDGEPKSVPTDSLRAGDLVEVRPGDVVPADGMLVEGETRFDQSLLTGESEPVTAVTDAPVWAGSRNCERVARVRVSASGSETRVGRLMERVESAVEAKPPVVQLADRIASVFVTVMIVLATVALAGWTWHTGLATGIDVAVALLIVACPCALALATPLSLAVAVARCAGRDTLVKRAAAMELLAKGGTMLLDKTGTLTLGRVELVAWNGDADLRARVALVESRSGHHLARAVCEAWGDLEPDAEARRAVAEQGVIDANDGGLRAMFDDGELLVGSPGFVRRNGVTVGDDLAAAVDAHAHAGRTPVVASLAGEAKLVLAFGDAERPRTAEYLRALERAGWSLEILSGDAQAVVRRVAEGLGIASATGEVSPEGKLDRVRALRAQGERVVMVGDGVNDAAALAAADVGVAVAGGAEASLLAADVYTGRPGLAPLAELVSRSRSASRTVRRNLAVSLSYNALFVSLALAGLITPLVAAIVMPISSMTVITLSLAGGVARRKELT